MRVSLVVFALLALASATFAQATAASITANNTAACSGVNAPSYCAGGFVGMSDAASGTYNPAPVNISKIDVHSLIYSGSPATQMFVHMQPWFCMNPGSTATGVGTLCGKHIQVGYNSNDPNTIHGQADDILSRGFNGMIVDWYGPNNMDDQAAGVRDELNARCGASGCPLFFALMEDDGAFKWTLCPYNGGGTDQTSCLIQALESDLGYMDQNYFGAPSYLKVDPVTQKPSPSGRPAVLFFICESCFTNPAPNWNYVWSQVRAYAQSFNNGNGLFIFRNGGAFTHTESDGGYAWPGWWGSNDPYGLVYLTNFYITASQYPNLLAIGGGWKGFDDTNASWGSGRVMQQQCGQTFLQTVQNVTSNSYWANTTQLPFLGIATWNDYEEGTEVETGIDNCLSLQASVSGTTLSWSLSFSQVSGSETTVHHYVVYDSASTGLVQVATVPAGQHSFNLKSYNFTAGKHTLYVYAVGQPMMFNHLSNSTAYSVGTKKK